MNWIGKLSGGILGLIAGGPIGAAVGALLGHQFDRGFGSFGRAGNAGGPMGGLSNASRQQVFFETTFLVMGHLAKADGRVSEEEIQAARAVMHQMRLRPEDVRRAIELFSAGKRPDFPIDRQVTRLRQACRNQPELIRTFLEIQLDLALSKDRIRSRERELLWRIADLLDVGRVELAQLEAVLRARRSFGQNRTASRQQDDLRRAYQALGIEANVSDRDVKIAYRRLMNQHHPDKQAARGLPDAMLEVAKERTREIRSAYELIKERRNIK